MDTFTDEKVTLVGQKGASFCNSNHFVPGITSNSQGVPWEGGTDGRKHPWENLTLPESRVRFLGPPSSSTAPGVN